MVAVRVGDLELAYIEAGSGAPLVLIHGALNDYRAWGSLVDRLAEHYRVIAYSRRYHHPNLWIGDGRDYSVDLHASDLVGLIEALELGPAHLVGSSFGAFVAVWVARRRPDLVRSLVLGEPPLLPLLERSDEGRQALAEFGLERDQAVAAFRRGDLERGVAIFVEAVMGDGAWERISPRGRGLVMENARAFEAEFAYGPGLPEITCADLAEVAAPALVLTGARTRRFFQLVADELATCLPRAERITIPDAAHSPHRENAEAYSAAVLRYLAGLTT